MKLLNKKFVHKHRDENVFVYNLRRILPYRIDQDVLEHAIKNYLAKSETDFILNYYLLEEGRPFKSYYLRSIPYLIDISGECANNISVNKACLELILRNYQQLSESNTYSISKNLHESDEIIISKALGLTKNLISDMERAKLSEILERVDLLEKRDIFYANMYVDTNHSYFFEHHNEHVPGMMIVEAARQLGIACYHVYGKVPIDAKFLILEIESKFYKYVELNFPIKMELINNFVPNVKSRFWSEIDGFVNFYQNDNLVAFTHVKGKCITSKAFEKIQRNRSSILESYEFIPRLTQNRYICLIDENGNKYDCSIISISLNFFVLATEEKFQTNSDFIFEAYFDDFEKVSGKCYLRNLHANNTVNIYEFEISQIEPQEIKILQEAIKKHFYVKEVI